MQKSFIITYKLSIRKINNKNWELLTVWQFSRILIYPCFGLCPQIQRARSGNGSDILSDITSLAYQDCLAFLAKLQPACIQSNISTRVALQERWRAAHTTLHVQLLHRLKSKLFDRSRITARPGKARLRRQMEISFLTPRRPCRSHTKKASV